MNVVVYGDFNCLLCYLASQRADHPAGTGAAGVEWPAVKRGAVPARWEQETAQAEALALPGERLPAGSPSALSNTAAAVAAYAEAITAAVAASLSWIVLPAWDNEPGQPSGRGMRPGGAPVRLEWRRARGGGAGGDDRFASPGAVPVRRAERP